MDLEFNSGFMSKKRSAAEWKPIIIGLVDSVAPVMSKLIGRELARAIEEQGIVTKAITLILGKRIEEAMVPYVSAVVLLVSSAREVNEENVRKLLEVVNIEPQENFMKFISTININTAMAAYAPALAYLALVTDKPDAELLMRVVKSLGFSPDIETAKYAIKEYVDKGVGDNDGESRLQQKLDSSISSASKMLSRLEDMEVERVFEMKNIEKQIGRGFVLYFGAVGVMEYLGRDIGLEGEDHYKEGLRKIIVATGVDPDEEMLDLMVHSLNLGNFPFVYAFAAYFIASVGQNPDVDKMIGVVKSMGFKTDPAPASYILTLYKEMSGAEKPS